MLHHLISKKILPGQIVASFVNSNDWLADIFVKSVRGPRISYICNKLDTYDIYTFVPASGRVLRYDMVVSLICYVHIICMTDFQIN